jgi:hypothetical protein
MRKTTTVTITTPGRDQGKVFLIREMPSAQSEKWAMRVFFALIAAGVDVPDDVAASGLAGVAQMGPGALGKLRFEDAEPLLDEMFRCVRIIPDPSRPEVVRDIYGDDDIEEIVTRLLLRVEVFALHTDFLPGAARSISALRARLIGVSSNTPTSAAA